MKQPNQLERINIAYNCRKATYLIEKKHLSKINLVETMELKMHLADCSVCRLFEQQSIMVHRMVRMLFHDQEDVHPKLDDVFKKALQKRIDEQAKKC
jgi:hypothetical protein